ncbi:ATP-binding protein [Polaribacter sp. AHE13PA]|uniref:ATP-binding protein n=1 Tax=Polaribacter sp. AHE13PA TaxID=2745562 RepID=UPI001C4F25AB|nr:ATP-binding protein [Polaribacter sp. AHE13PA]
MIEEKDKVQDPSFEQKDISKELFSGIQKLMPWLDIATNENPISHGVKEAPNNWLDTFYLFPLTEVSIKNKEEDVPSFIKERYSTILSAASKSGITVATIVSGKNGRNTIYLGLKRENTTNQDVDLFSSLINGILPGKKIKYNGSTKFSTLSNGYTKGGIITGIPALKVNDEKVEFNIASVIRSLYGKEYILAIISTPLPPQDHQYTYSELLNLRDKFHALAKQTKGNDEGITNTTGTTDQNTTGESKTRGHNFNLSIIVAGYSYNRSKTTTNSKSYGTNKSKTINISESLSYEQQNGIALELEKLTEHLLERTVKGFNTGMWETSIAFSAKDEITCEILGGSFLGELSKPSDKLLPPSQMFIGDLKENQSLFLPVNNNENSIFPKSLSSYITSEELAFISSPPFESLPGFEIKKMPALALNDINDNDGLKIGNIADYGNPLPNSYINLTTNDLNKHLFVCGLTGSGKTTTVKTILKDLTLKENIPFLVIESAKRDYRQLLADDVFKNNLNIYTVGDASVSPIRFNPFYVQKGIHLSEHIDYLKAIFNASFSLYGPMPAIVEKCIHNIYAKKGWNITKGFHPYFTDSVGNYNESGYDTKEHLYFFPTLSDLKSEVENYVKNELAYKGELQDNIRTAIVVRIESLSVGAKGMMFDTHDFHPMEDLLKKNTILEMESLADDDDKAFFVGLMLVMISQYRQKDNPAVNPGMGAKGLQHFMVIEEAHRLLKNVSTEKTSESIGNPKGKAVELFTNVIAEMRSLGQGVAVVEQIPSKISPDVIKNTNTKIVHRLVSKDDQSLLAGSLSISDDDALYMSRLVTGRALVHKEGMERPVECAMINNINSAAASDNKVYKLMQKNKIETLHPFEVYELSTVLGQKGKVVVQRLLNSLCTIEYSKLKSKIELFNKALEQEIILSGSQFDKVMYSQYAIKQIFSFLTQGFYRTNNRIPEGLKKVLHNLFTHNKEEDFLALKSYLSLYWGMKDDDFVNRIVSTLAKNMMLKANVHNIDEVKDSYFLNKKAV